MYLCANAVNVIFDCGIKILKSKEALDLTGRCEPQCISALKNGQI